MSPPFPPLAEPRVLPAMHTNPKIPATMTAKPNLTTGPWLLQIPTINIQ